MYIHSTIYAVDTFNEKFKFSFHFSIANIKIIFELFRPELIKSKWTHQR